MNATETFQHYQVLRRDDGSLWELGRGAMGVTYKAFDVNLRSLVALKVINGNYLDHPIARQRFIREARAAAALRHRNIAHVYHLGMDAQSFFYAMEFIDGETLDALVRRQGPLPPEAVLRIALQTARALSAAARQRLVHRDIKPANLMILAEDEDGEVHQTVKVIDFGLARSAVRGDASTHLTMSGFVGTPQYASPEQLEEKNVDGRSDIYSLGVTLWYLLVGRPPFIGTLTGLITQHLTKEPPWEQLAAVPGTVRELLARMLQKDPDRRPQSAGELKIEVEACLRSLPVNRDLLSFIADGVGPAFRDPEDDHLEGAVPRSEGKPESSKPGVFEPTVGSLVGGRYQVMRLAGEGSTGRVFQARDLRGEGQTVALKVLHPELLITPTDHDALRAEIAKVRAAPHHPGLLRLLDFEGARESTYLVTEWSGGLTLVDLLRNRGRLTIAEALQLLKQAASLTDFARANGLDRLELHLHQIFVLPAGLATGFSSSSNDDETAALLAKTPLAVNLLIDPIGLARDDGQLVTWSGDLTLLSSQPPILPGSSDGCEDTRATSYLQSLARVFYELIEGAPPPGGQWPAQSGGQVFMVPGLGEAGSAILRRGLSAAHGFSTDTEFFEMLARAVGYEPDNVRFQPVVVPPPALPPPSGEGADTADAPLSRMKETTALPPREDISPAAKPTTRLPLKPIGRRPRGSHTLTIELRTLGWLVGGIVVCLAVVATVLIALWSSRRDSRNVSVPDSRQVGSSISTVLPKAVDGAPDSIGKLVTPPSNATGVASEPGADSDDAQEDFPMSEWLEGTALAEAIALPITVIPYAPGFDPDEGADTADVRVPYAPRADQNEMDATSEKAPSEEDMSSPSIENGSTTGTAKSGAASKASNGGTHHSHSRSHGAPPPRNFWQRLFGIKPKPTHAK